MDSLVPLFTTTDGRISRKTWWFGVVILILASIVLNLILGVFGISAAWAQLIAFAIMFVPNWSIGIKRRQDRDSDARDFKIFLAISGILTVLQALGIGTTDVDVAGVPTQMPSLPLSLVYVAVGIYGIYVLVQLGFLRGTTGSNSFGPDPLDGAA